MKKIIYLVVAFIFITGCTSLKTPEINGVVVDAETGKPITDARIYAKWQRIMSGPGGQTGGKVTKELRLATGKDGRFSISAYNLLNPVPYPFGQGGFFHIVVYAHGYMNKSFTFYQTRDMERAKYEEFKKLSVENKLPIKLTEIRDPSKFSKNETEVYPYVKEDQKYLADDDKLFLDKFGKKRWDRVSQNNLAETYAKYGDYKSAIRKIEELIEDYPEEGKHYLKKLEEYKSKFREIEDKKQKGY